MCIYHQHPVTVFTVLAPTLAVLGFPLHVFDVVEAFFSVQ
jgi:hypothetical protein